jgi:hypothetical protein
MLRGPLSIEAVIDSTTVRGYWDDSEQWVTDAAGEQVKQRGRMFSVYAGDLPAVPAFDTLATVSGAHYKIRNTMLADDGAILTVTLVPA